MTASPLALALALVFAGALAPRPAGAGQVDARVGKVDARTVDNEVALAHAARALDAGDAHAAMAHLARVDLSAPSLPAFRRAALEGRALVLLGRTAEAMLPLREAATLAASCGAALGVPLELALARAERASGDCRAALRALRRAGSLASFDEDSVVLQAACHEDLDEPQAAAADLDAGLAARPGSLRLRRARARLLLSRGLVLAAAPDVRSLLAAPEPLTADEALALAGELSSVGAAAADALAIDVMDRARQAHPDDVRLPATLARLLRARTPRLAAETAHVAALLDDSLRLDHAELEREAGAFASALRANAAGGDPAGGGVARLRQRLAILVDARAWDRALALEPRLVAAGLRDAPVTYALAYASLRVGDPARAEALVDEVTDPAFFERATALRAAIAACAHTDEPCAP